MDVARFLASSTGRIVRIVAGVVIILIGFLWAPSPWSYVLELVGLVPIAAGVFDFCLLSALTGHPFWGRDIRAQR